MFITRVNLSLEETHRVESAFFAANASRTDIDTLCSEARTKNYYAVCVSSSHIELARALLDNSEVQVVALIDFPFGLADADAKRYETEIAIDLGAHEIDYVVNIGRLRDGDTKYVLREMRDIAEAADERPVKAVLETNVMTREEKILACKLALDSGVHFVCAGFDFFSHGATIEDVRLLRETLGGDFGLKACSNVHYDTEALKLISAGATRVGVMAGMLE